jgi:hypothetical protein
MEHRTESSNNGITETTTYIHNNGGKPRRQRTEQQRGDGRPQRSLEVSATLLRGGLDSSPQVKQVMGVQQCSLRIRTFTHLVRIRLGWIPKCEVLHIPGVL